MTDVKIRCDDCKFVENCVDYGWQECKKFTPKPSEPKTNEDWLRSCNTEQLAEVLHKIFMTNSFCHICPEGDVCDLGYECKYHGGKICDFMKWLKATHRG